MNSLTVTVLYPGVSAITLHPLYQYTMEKLKIVSIQRTMESKSKSNSYSRYTHTHTHIYTRVVLKVMSNFFLHANWEQQTKESAVVDGTSCCVILECLVTSIACIT